MISKQICMKQATIYFYTACLFFLNAASTKAQGIIVQQGSYLRSKDDVSLVAIKSGITGDGNVNLSTATLVLQGTGDVNIGTSNGFTVKQLNIKKALGTVLLAKDINVSDEVNLQKGLLDLDTKNLLLDSTANINGETETARIVGSNGGEIVIALKLNKPQNANPGNLGINITSSKDLGLVTIKRGHKQQSGSTVFNKSILRYYNIAPANNAQLAATVRFNYFDAELNGTNETSAALFKSFNNGSAWSNVNSSSKDINANYIQAQSVSTLAMFTIANPLTNVIAKTSDNTTTKALIKNNNSKLRAWPLPATGPLSVQLFGEDQSTEASVYNAAGKIIQQIILKPGSATVIPHLTPGTYFIKTNNPSVNSLKIIVQ